MNISIQTQFNILLNLLVLGVGIAIGWFSLNIMSNTLQEQLLSKPAKNFSGLINRMNLPLTDQLMRQISDAMNCQAAVVSPDNSKVICSSLPKQNLQLLASNPERQPIGKISINDVKYRVSEPANVTGIPGYTGDKQAYLLMLMPQARLKAESRTAWVRILAVTLSALAIATVIGLLLAAKIARPMRILAQHMDCMSTRTSLLESENDMYIPPKTNGPSEVKRLRQSFNNLLCRLRQSQSDLESAAKMATTAQLSAAVAHEIRNPLSGIKMNVHVLADRLKSDDEDENQEIKNQILQNIDRIDMFVKELMRVSIDSPDNREAATQFSREAETVSLIEISRNITTLLQPQCRHAGVTISEDFDDNAQWVYANSEDIRQVILNLLLNAVEAVGSQNGEIKLSTQQSADNFFRYSIVDTGSGIPEEMKNRIFDPLVTTKEYGTGLGLFVCRQIIHKNNGSIGFEILKDGTEFWFELPAKMIYE